MSHGEYGDSARVVTWFLITGLKSGGGGGGEPFLFPLIICALKPKVSTLQTK